MDEGNSRPLDTLNQARNKSVLVDLKNGTKYVGKLKAFDIHINTVLEDAEEHVNGELKLSLFKKEDSKKLEKKVIKVT